MILALQNDLQSLNVVASNFDVYQRLREADLPQAVMDSIQPTTYNDHFRQSMVNLSDFEMDRRSSMG